MKLPTAKTTRHFHTTHTTKQQTTKQIRKSSTKEERSSVALNRHINVQGDVSSELIM